MWKTTIIICAFLVICSGTKHEKVILSDVQTLTLYRNQYTTGRRTPPVLQLKCMGGSAAKSEFHPEVVQCYNRGMDGRDVQWECKADLDNAVRFGKINVYCEGYDYPDDPYVLKGSCGLEYHLEYTGNGGTGQKYNQKASYKTGDDSETSGGSVIFFIIACVIIYLIYSKCIRQEDNDGRPRGGGHSDFRGGGPPPPPYGGPPPPYDDRPSAPPGDAPPPYGFRPEHSSKQQGASASGFQEQAYRQQRPNPMGAGAGVGAGAGAGAEAGQGPGFWTGLGTGGVLGYLFGRNTGGSHYGGGSSWTQPGYVPPTTRRPYGDDRDFGFFGSRTTGSTSSSSGTGTRSASGFGGTRRR